MHASSPVVQRRALVTGSADGLGLAIGTAFLAQGYSVVFHGLEPESAVQERLIGLTKEHPGRVAYVAVDLASHEGATALAERALDILGGVDILVNNAVTRHFHPIECFPDADWDRALAVNLSAVFQLAKRLVPGMRAQGFGRIINMASVYGMRGTPNRIDYVTTKAAIIGFTRGLAAELRGRGVTSNAICPGTVLTPAIEGRVQSLIHAGMSRAEAEAEVLRKKQPSGTFVEAGDVAALALYLCSDAAKDIQGAVLPVEGGWLAS